MRHLLLYVLRTKKAVFSRLKIVSINGNHKNVDLTQNFKTFSCDSEPKLSWLSDGTLASQQWIPISNHTVSGFLYSYRDCSPKSTWSIELQLRDESESVSSSSKFAFECSYEDDQDLVIAKIHDDPSDELYLYYLFVDEYHKPQISLGEPRAAKFMQVTYPNNKNQLPMLMGHAGAGVKRLHQGLGREWPENTLCAFRRAQQVGLPMVECDATVTKDCAEVVLHHNFTLKIKSNQTADGRPVLEHLPDGNVDQSTTGLICHQTLSEIRALLNQKRPTPSELDMTNLVSFAYPKPLTLTDPCPDASGPEGNPVPLLKDVFFKTPTNLGFNIEIKYPPETPYIWAGRQMAAGQPIDSSLPGPYNYFCLINKFCDKILDTIWHYAGPRSIALSSFNADVCLALRLKQTEFPVLFITRGGQRSDPGSDHDLDPRHSSVPSAAQWASLMNLQGLVTLGSHFGSDTSEHPTDLRNVGLLCEDLDRKKLACFVYGPGVSDFEFRRQATKFGLSGLIIDRVDEYMQEVAKEQQAL